MLLLDQFDDPTTDAFAASFVWDDEEELASSSPEHVACAGALSDLSVKTSHSERPHSDLGEPPPGLWLVDTGCGQDLINASGAYGYDSVQVPGLTFSTANGRATATEALQC